MLAGNILKKDIIRQYLYPLKPKPTSLEPRGKLRQKVACLLFDVYGTLFISGSGDISLAKQNAPALEKIAQLLSDCGIRKSPRTLLTEYYTAIEAVHADLREDGVDFPEVDIEQIWTQVLKNDHHETVRQFAAEFEMIVNPVYPMPNLEATLSALRHQSTMMGIISNAQFYTPCLFNWFLDANPHDLGFSRDLLYYSYRFAVAKPSLRLFEMAAQRIAEKGLSPTSVLYIGNLMLNDNYPARQTGFRTALFAGDERSLRLRSDDPRCRGLRADLVITDLSQLIEYV